MAERSKRIRMYSKEKMELVNKDTMKLVRKYEVDMTIRELSPKSVKQYLSDINQWLIYILDYQFNVSVINITEDDITEFLYYCKTNGNNTERMKRRMSSISGFYIFLRKKRIMKENPMEFVDRPKKGLPIVVQTFLTPKQVQLMRDKLKEHGNLQLETYALFSLSTMCRVNAVANLKWKQIDFDTRTCNEVLEKEGKVVVLYFSEEVKELLTQLLQHRQENNIEDYGWVFFSKHNTVERPISTGALNDWCKKIGTMIDVPTLHPHDFRHSAATLLKNSGMAIEDVSHLLNHSGIDVTRKYYIKEDTARISQMKDQFTI